GAGFYYIPGTETCLKVGGYLRVQIGVGGGELNGDFELGGHQDVLDRSTGLFDNDTYSWLTRANFHLDARTETELGTLRSYMEISFNEQSRTVNVVDTTTTPPTVLGQEAVSGNGGATIEHAYIQLGGFTLGYSDSLYETLTDSAGALVINDSIVGYTPGK